MNVHDRINYIEFPVRDLEATKGFFAAAFGWSFTDYGPDYADSDGGGVMTGFYRADLASTTLNGGALVTFYSENLESTQEKVTEHGGVIVKPIFSFPGGRRFEFTEPSGNQLAVWSDR